MKKVVTIGVVTMCFLAGQVVGEIAQRDQYQDSIGGGGYFWSGSYYAQTFTCGSGGQLDHVNIYCYAIWGEPYQTTLSVVESVGGTPDGSLLGEVSVPYLSREWNTFNFAEESVMLTEGIQYAIILTNNIPSITHRKDAVGIQWDSNPYIGGGLWRWESIVGWEQYNPHGVIGDSDMVFETWMVPEPATLFLLAIGGLLLRKRK